MPGDASNNEALSQVAQLAALGLGTGVSIRGLLGLRDMLSRSLAKRRKNPSPAVVEIGVPRYEGEKAAAGEALFNYPPGFLESKEPNAGDWLLGRTHENKWSKPWFATAALGAPALGIYGGYKLVDMLLEKARKREKEQELEGAKEEYRNALMSQYTPDKVKHGASDELAKDLDELVSLVKSAELGDAINNGAGFAAGAYAPLALLLGGSAALGTYNWAKKRSPEAQLAKAMKQRERLRWASKPPEIYAVVKPIHVKKRDHEVEVFHPGTEAEEEEVKKIASLYKP